MNDNQQIKGSLAVQRRATVGGRLTVGSDTSVAGNMRVGGWLEAPNIKDVCKGLFSDADALSRQYPEPRPGWWALVGDTIPAEIYRSERGAWVATGETGGEIKVDLNHYNDEIERLDDRIDNVDEQVEVIKDKVSNIQHPVSVENTNTAKLIVCDDNRQPLITVGNDGHIRTSAFDSSNIRATSGSDVHPVTVEDTDLADLIIADENRRAILSVVNGHIRTARFNSANIQTSQGSGSSGSEDIDPSMPNPYDSLYGKQWCVLGDSFSEGDFTGVTTPCFDSGIYMGEKKVYPYYVGNRTGITVHNLSRCGRTLTSSENSLLSVCQDIPVDADYITIYIGINDSDRGRSIGSDDSTDNTTFSGAYNILLQWLITYRPYAHIGIIVSPASNSANWPDFDAATRRAARRYGIPILDIGGGEDVPYFHRQTMKQGVLDSLRQLRDSQYRVSASNWHPNEKAHLLLSHLVEQFLRRI